MHNNLTGSIAFCKINYFACSYLFITCIHKLCITSIINNPLPTVYKLLSQKFEKHIYAQLSVIRVLAQTNVLYVTEINQQCL